MRFAFFCSMNRIVAPDIDGQGGVCASQVHDYTLGINDDPLTLVAILFSALIHDCDHRGVSNAQLAKEDAEMATHYHNKSISEQNSLDLGWDLLMSSSYADLRATLFVDREEMMPQRGLRGNPKNSSVTTGVFGLLGQILDWTRFSSS